MKTICPGLYNEASSEPLTHEEFKDLTGKQWYQTSGQSLLAERETSSRLAIGEEEDRGLGLKTLQEVKAGQILCVYGGEITNTPVLSKYAITAEPEVGYIGIDADKFASAAAFSNHGVPNSIMVRDKDASGMPYLVATRDMEAGEYINWNYMHYNFDDCKTSMNMDRLSLEIHSLRTKIDTIVWDQIDDRQKWYDLALGGSSSKTQPIALDSQQVWGGIHRIQILIFLFTNPFLTYQLRVCGLAADVYGKFWNVFKEVKCNRLKWIDLVLNVLMLDPNNISLDIVRKALSCESQYRGKIAIIIEIHKKLLLKGSEKSKNECLLMHLAGSIFCDKEHYSIIPEDLELDLTNGLANIPNDKLEDVIQYLLQVYPSVQHMADIGQIQIKQITPIQMGFIDKFYGSIDDAFKKLLFKNGLSARGLFKFKSNGTALLKCALTPKRAASIKNLDQLAVCCDRVKEGGAHILTFKVTN
jgi:hypothetical protein